MCSSGLNDVKGATVGVQLFFSGRRIEARNLHSSDSSTQAFVILDPSFHPRLTTGSGLLRTGRYRCRFLARRRLVHERTFVLRAGG
jgi:hypothetical protein